jgi:hypothetical protein
MSAYMERFNFPANHVDFDQRVLNAFTQRVVAYGKGTDAIDIPMQSGFITEQQAEELHALRLMYLQEQIAQGIAPTDAEIYAFISTSWVDGLLEIAGANMLRNPHQFLLVLRLITSEIKQGKRDPRDLHGRVHNSQWSPTPKARPNK